VGYSSCSLQESNLVASTRYRRLFLPRSNKGHPPSPQFKMHWSITLGLRDCRESMKDMPERFSPGF